MVHEMHRREVLMNAITVRNLPPAVAKVVKEKVCPAAASVHWAAVVLPAPVKAGPQDVVGPGEDPSDCAIMAT